MRARFHSRVLLAACLVSLFFALVGYGQEVIRLEPRETSERVFLDKGPEGVVFDGRGLIVYGGESQHFSSPPKFILYSASKRNPDGGVGYPSTRVLEGMELPNEEIYPMQLRDLHSPSLTGVSVIGRQSPLLPWRVIKSMWDGDALHAKHCTGTVTVSDVYWENVEDGFGPLEGIEFWSLQHSYLRYIRDDAVENDDLIAGEIVDCLIDGCFTFLSQRSEPPRRSSNLTSIRDCLIHVQAQPHDGIPGKQWRDRNIAVGEDGIGRAPGMLFKWEKGAGKVEMKNCVVRIDAISVNGTEDMAFPEGTYENVKLVWLGEGNYPRPLPEGVLLTRDLDVWTKARAKWVKRLEPKHPAFGKIPE